MTTNSKNNTDYAQLQAMGQAQRDGIAVGRYAEFTPSQLAQFFEGAEGIRGRMAGMPEYAEYELWLDGIPGYLVSLDADIIRSDLAKAQDTTDALAAAEQQRDQALEALSQIVDRAFDTEYNDYSWEEFDTLRWIARRALSSITSKIVAAEALKGKAE